MESRLHELDHLGVVQDASDGTVSRVAGSVVSAQRWREKIWPRGDAGPMAATMADLMDWLVAEGYAPTTQRNIVRAAARLGSWMSEAGSEQQARHNAHAASHHRHEPPARRC